MNKIRTDYINQEVKSKILELAQQYSAIFYCDNDEEQIYSKSYPYPFIYNEEVQTKFVKWCIPTLFHTAIHDGPRQIG